MPTESRRLEETLSSTFGLQFTVTDSNTGSGRMFTISPVVVHPHEGFKLEVLLDWRSVRAEFVPGPFARDLIEGMGSADDGARTAFQDIAGTLLSRKMSLAIRLNGVPVNPCDSTTWPSMWTSVGIEIRGHRFDRTIVDEERDYREVLSVAEGALALVLALAAEPDFKEVKEAVDLDVAGYPEGAVMQVRTNRYERDPRNRGLSIAAHGVRCAVCELSFESLYGELGRGYIHVHHVVPVSQVGPDYRVNPVRDLIPVCPNCHSMLHRESPPMTVEGLRMRLDEQRRSSTQ